MSVRRSCGFTFVEVMVATAILAFVAAGALAASWRLAGFARDEAEILAADGYCHDVMWRFMNMSDSDLAAHGEKIYDVPKNTLPVMLRTVNGKREATCPLWREAYAAPKCTVKVAPCEANGTILSSFDNASNVLVSVTMKWGRAEDADKTNVLTVIRAGNVDRWKNVAAK